MKFNAWSRKRIQEGKKRLTSRTRPYEDSTVQYITPPLEWWFIRDFLYRGEGAESPEELQRIINQVQRRKVKDNETFFVHVLKEA